MDPRWLLIYLNPKKSVGNIEGVSVRLSIWKLTTGMTWVTPSPLSMTVPVSVLSPTCLDVQEAARASTA